MPFSESARFVWSSFQERYGSIKEFRSEAEFEDRKWPLRVYESIKPVQGLIVAVNGFSVYGDEDPRIHNICRAMATAGFRVVQPTFKDLNALFISTDSIYDMAACLRALAEDENLSPDGKVGLFAPSFTAGLGLLACADPLVNERISSICAIGTFANIDSCIEFVMTGEDIDDYGRLVLMRNFVELSTGPNPELVEALDIAIKDNGFKRQKPELPAFIERMAKENRALFEKLQNSAEFRQILYQEILRTKRCQEIYNHMNVIKVLDEIHAPVTLIHGASDDVIHPEESVMLHKALREKSKSSHLLLTPLLTHGDIKVGVGVVGQAIQLIQAFQFFFRNAKAK
jgi:pimeloyl-ACP methyl ester carboxylesterase